MRALALTFLLVATLQAQSPSFEVASIKRRTVPGPTAVTQGQGPGPGGAFNRINTTLLPVILFAYDMRDYQLVGGPDWMRTDRFDILARAGREVSTSDLRLMVRSLLEDRFKLVAHREQREMPIYTLVPARSDGRLGPGLKRSDDECKRLLQRPSNVPVGAATSIGCGQAADLANMASRMMGAPVIDKTGLVGRFEHFLYYSRDGIRPFGLPSTVPSDGPAADPSLPSFQTALQDHLGLKLESTRGLVDVLVIDSVQLPTEN